MEKWKYAAYAAMLLLLLVITADAVIVARYAMMPRPSAEPVVAEAEPTKPAASAPKKSAPRVEPEAAQDASKFPPSPSRNGEVTEQWDGYYYSSTEPFEQAIAQGVYRVRFWFEVRRTADGSFQAACNETTGLGEARIDGFIDRAAGQMQFKKRYTQGAEWDYVGVWSPAEKRIVGNYGGGQGGFVLYPRRLKQDEVTRFEMPAGVQPLNVFDRGVPVPMPETPPGAPNKPAENVIF